MTSLDDAGSPVTKAQWRNSIWHCEASFRRSCLSICQGLMTSLVLYKWCGGSGLYNGCEVRQLHSQHRRVAQLIIGRSQTAGLKEQRATEECPALLIGTRCAVSGFHFIKRNLVVTGKIYFSTNDRNASQWLQPIRFLSSRSENKEAKRDKEKGDLLDGNTALIIEGEVHLLEK